MIYFPHLSAKAAEGRGCPQEFVGRNTEKWDLTSGSLESFSPQNLQESFLISFLAPEAQPSPSSLEVTTRLLLTPDLTQNAAWATFSLHGGIRMTRAGGIRRSHPSCFLSFEQDLGSWIPLYQGSVFF